MGILDAPKGLLSRLPLVGGSNEPKDEDEPDEVETDEHVEEDEPDSEDAPVEDQEDEPDSEEPHPDSDPDGSGREAEQPAGSDSEEAAGSDSEQPAGSGSDSSDTEDVSDITAPSIGPNTKIEKEDPEERLARHEQSDTDAMGLDKRREVIGGNYSASFGKQMFRWALVVVVVAGAVFGAKLLVDDLDKPPAKVADEAPWTGNDREPAALE